MIQEAEQPKISVPEVGMTAPEKGERERPFVDPEAIARKQVEKHALHEKSRADAVGDLGRAEAVIRNMQTRSELEKKSGEVSPKFLSALNNSLRRFAQVLGTAAVLSVGSGIEQALHNPASAATFEKQPGISSIADQDNYEKMKQTQVELESGADKYAQYKKTHERIGDVRITYFSLETKQALEQQGIEINDIGIMANMDTSADAMHDARAFFGIGSINFHAEGIRDADHLDKATEVELVVFKLLKDGKTVEGGVQYQDGHSGFFLVRNGVIELVPSK